MKKSIITLFIVACLTISGFAQNSVKDFFEADIVTIKKVNPKAEAIISAEDLGNGFMSYGVPLVLTGFKEMAYFISNNGKKFVAVATFGCGPACATTDFSFFELQNGTLVDKTDSYFTSTLQNKVNVALSPYADKGFWVKVPQQGLNIQFGYPEGPAMDDSVVNFVCELQFNVADGTFTFVEK